MNRIPYSELLSTLTISLFALQAFAETNDTSSATSPQEKTASTIAMLPLVADTPPAHDLFQDNGSAPIDFELEEKRNEFIRFSLRGGVHDWKDSSVDSSYGIQGEILYSLPNLPIDIDLRAYYANAEFEPNYYMGSFSSRDYLLIYQSTAYLREEIKKEGYGGSAQVRWNFNKGAIINPYVSAGAIYEKYEDTCNGFLIVETDDIGLWTHNHYRNTYLYTYEDSYDDDGISWIARFGFEGNLDPFYLRMEVSIVGEIYDTDSVQAEIFAMAGVNLTDHIRLELAGDYFTEWEEYYITAGLSVGF